MSNDPIILSFHEALLHKSDIDLLNGPYWLNDNIISFYFEYLENIVYKDEVKFLFVSPDVTQCLKVSPSGDLSVFLDPLQVEKRHFIFFVLNNCVRTDSPGGTHWSLLVYSKLEYTFYHFDSSARSNFEQARQLASNLSQYLIFSELQELDSIQQANGYDCGIHVLCNVDLITEFCAKQRRVKGCGKVAAYSVAAKRAEVLHLIKSLSSRQ